MITGHIQEKKGRYYMVLNLRNRDGSWKPKWKATGLPVKGNKKRAELLLRSTIQEYENFEKRPKGLADTILFSDFLKNWLEMLKNNIEETTYGGYHTIVHKIICPFFEKEGITLRETEDNPQYIQKYYSYLMNERGVKATTVHRHHANIRKALQYAVKTNLILSNPADKVDKPKKQPFHASFYSDAQLSELFERTKDSKLYLAILITAYYGLRRSETLGLKWNAIDFENKTISIRHTVTTAMDANGKSLLIQKDRTKNTASYRSLPLIPEIEKALLEKQAEDKGYRKLCGNSYNKQFLEYIFVDEIGCLFKPDRLTRSFPQLLEKHELERIRFHDLRHSCASLLLKHGIQMKAIQEWLGHSNFSTTANTYAHLDANSKQEAADVVMNAFFSKEETKSSFKKSPEIKRTSSKLEEASRDENPESP